MDTNYMGGNMFNTNYTGGNFGTECTEESEVFFCNTFSDMLSVTNKDKQVDVTDLFQSGWIWASIGFYAPLCMFGVIGNILTIIMFAKYIKQTTTSVFIIALAVIDLLVCAIRMPVFLYDLIDDYGSDFLCKFNNAIYLTSIPLSGALLLVIAIDRFILIFLVRFNVITLFRAKIIVGILSIACVSYAVPQAMCFTTLVPLPRSVTASVCNRQILCNRGTCSVQFELMTKRVWHRLWQSMIISLLLMVATFTIIYVLIFAKVYGSYKRIQKWKQTSRKGIEVDLSTVSETQQTSEPDESNTNSNGNSDTATKVVPTKSKRFPHVRMALTLFLVTICFVVSYAPLLIMILLGTCSENNDSMSVCDENDYRTFLWRLFYINHVANPVIYAFMNPRFREAVRSCMPSMKKRRVFAINKD